MITKSEAEQLVIAELAATEADLLVTDIQDLDWGWVFFYNSREYAETGDFRDGLAGNAPYIVDAQTGAVVITGTALPIDRYVEDYQLEHGY